MNILKTLGIVNALSSRIFITQGLSNRAGKQGIWAQLSISLYIFANQDRKIANTLQTFCGNMNGLNPVYAVLEHETIRVNLGQDRPCVLIGPGVSVKF